MTKITLKTATIFVWSFGVAALIFVLVLTSAAVPFNNITLRNFSQQLFEAPIPGNTVIVERHSTANNFTLRRGNSLDFLAVILVRSEQTKYELQEHFESLDFRRARGVESLNGVEVLPQTNNRLDASLFWRISNEFFSEDINFSQGNYFTVYILDRGYSALFDARGWE